MNKQEESIRKYKRGPSASFLRLRSPNNSHEPEGLRSLPLAAQRSTPTIMTYNNSQATQATNNLRIATSDAPVSLPTIAAQGQGRQIADEFGAVQGLISLSKARPLLPKERRQTPVAQTFEGEPNFEAVQVTIRNTWREHVHEWDATAKCWRYGSSGRLLGIGAQVSGYEDIVRLSPWTERYWAGRSSDNGPLLRIEYAEVVRLAYYGGMGRGWLSGRTES